MGILVSGTMLVPSLASAFNAQLQGKSFGGTNWIASNLSGWHELDLIPMRVYLTGGPATNKVITVHFDHTRSSGKLVTPGVQNLSQFVASPNVTITSAPILTDQVGDVWAYSFTVSLNNNSAGYVEFRARLGAGAHLFPGSSLALGGSPSLGNVQISKPAAAIGDPDLAITKSGPATANPGTTLSYTLTYTNQAGSAALGVQATDILPDAVSLLNCSGCERVGNEIIFDLGDLENGDGGSLTYEVTLDAGATGGMTFTNHAQILSAEDDADYANNVAEVTTTVTIVCIEPSIAADPQSLSVCEGQEAAFSVAANGTAIQYQWRKNGVNIPGATDSSYTIASASAGDSGWYDVVITNACGSITSVAATLNTLDSEPPVLGTCPSDVTASTDAGMCTATVTFNTPSATDSCTTPSVQCEPASGSAFAIGTTTVTCTATDGSGNTANCSFFVTVQDDTAPAITCPADIQLECGASSDPSNTGSATATDNCTANPTLTHSDQPVAGGLQRTWKATDEHGNEATCVQTIQIVDTTAPTITAPADVEVKPDPDQCTASVVELGSPSASDICGSVTLNNDAPSAFPVGTTIVTWTATDENGNTSTSQQSVTVVDNQSPTVSCPADVAVSTDDGLDTASNVSLGSPTVNENCGSVTIQNDAPSTYPMGTTMVTWTITDEAGNTTTCQQQVSVGDSQPPSMECPSSVLVEAERQATEAVVNYSEPAATDNTGIQSVLCEPVSGSPFPIGTNLVKCTATDNHGNTATCSFDVIVEPAGGEEAGGPSDVDLYVSKGVFAINRTSENADRLIIKGKMNPRGCAADMSGATITIRVNGTPVLGPQALTAKGTFAAATGKGKFSNKNGKYAFSVSGVDIAELVGLPNVTGSGLVAVTVEVEIENAGLATPVVTGEFEFAYKSAQDRATAGKFSFKKNRTLTGAYNLNRTSAKMVGHGYVFSALGPILLDGSMPVVPRDDIILTIGGQDMVIPMSSLVRTGEDDATSIYTYNASLGAVPGLAQFVLDNRKRAFRVITSELDATGLPMPGNGEPTAHNLEFTIDFMTDGGNQIAESIVEPKRKSPTGTAWKR
jgi:uncharacterized repeat protein (TIGR01451 family)